MNANRFDAVVIGSGFGGAVTSYRLAQAGLSVCVLERGKSYPPGSFPRAPHEMARNFWAPDDRLFGLFDVRSFRGKLWSIVGSGLGGGSLIYAGALHRMDSLDEQVWPITRADLDAHYDRVERMLDARSFPFGTGMPYDDTPKTRAFKQASDRLGLPLELPNLGIAFADEGREPSTGMPIREAENLHGSRRFTCRLCGECNLGCNHGSKSSLDFNYLSEAHRFGAEIRTLSEAREIAPRADGGYVIRYVRHSPDERNNTSSAQVLELHAKRLILAAGTFGTTELLLRNRWFFPSISRMLGRRFSGNGNLLTFAMHARDETTGKPLRLEPWRGPVITSAIRVPGGRRGEKIGWYIRRGRGLSSLSGLGARKRPAIYAGAARTLRRHKTLDASIKPRGNESRSIAGGSHRTGSAFLEFDTPTRDRARRCRRRPVTVRWRA